MAFKDVNESSKFMALTSLEEGGSITGYVTGITDSTKIEGQKNLQMVIDGSKVTVATAGNVKYMLQDGKISIGPNTRITRLEDTKIKGKRATRYKVEQDFEDIFSGAALPSGSSAAPSTASSSSSVKEKIEKLKGLNG